MDANEQRARELLADAPVTRYIGHDFVPKAFAVRAIMAALAQQVPADGEVKAWLIRADNGMAIKCVMSEQERDALLFRGESSQFPEWTATPLVEAATPQVPQPVVDASQPQQGAVAFKCERARIVGWWNCQCGECRERSASNTIGQQAVDDVLAAILHGCPNDGGDEELILRRAWDRARIAALAAHGKGDPT